MGQIPEMWELLASSAYEWGVGVGSEGEIKGKESEGVQPGKDQEGPTGDNMTSVLLCRGVARIN